MKNNKTENHRLETTKKYFDTLQEQNSKLNVIRVDLSYQKTYSDKVTLEEANKDLNRLLNNRRSKPAIFEHNIGYVIKREYTEDKGVHMHALFVYDGQQVKKDAYKAEQIGQYWKDNITKEKGSYHNCHRNNYEEIGIGMINHKDSDKRQILDDKVISYLCKDEQDIAPLKSNKKDRAFTRGIIQKRNSSVGRPRK